MIKNLVGFLLAFFCFGVAFADTSSLNNRLPGSSIADARLQADTLMPVFMATYIVTNQCEEITVVDTKVTKKPTYKQRGAYLYADSAWNETWYLKACGKKVSVPITFIPDSTGTSYAINQDNIKVTK